MKICTRCKIEKSNSEFGKLKAVKDGLSFYCKKCNNEKAKIWKTIPGNREKVNKDNAKYRRSEKGKIVKKRYYQSEKGQNHYKNYNSRTRKKIAREAVGHAIEQRKIPPAKELKCLFGGDTCEGKMEYHHHKGYSKRNRLDVIPLCRKHHCIIEGNIYHS